jgi:PAS domain S-box-containing protein
VFELAYHFDAARQSRRALPYALAAAAQARAQHALEIAEQQYRIAQRGVTPDDATTCYRIAEGLGEVLMLRGRYPETAEQLEAALALAREDMARAQIEGKLGELAFKRGDVQGAQARIETALRLLGRPTPRWSSTFLVLVLWEVFVQLLHTLLPRFFLARRRLDGPEVPFELLAMRLYSLLAHLYWFHRGTTAALWAHLHNLNLAERYPPTPELAQAYSEHAPGMSLLAYFSRGIAYAERSLVIRKEQGDLWGQGQSHHYYGVVLYAASRFEECIQHCREAIRLLERTGDYWEVNIARYQVAASLYRLGDLRGALAEAQALHQSGLNLGDAQASGISLDVWARAALGDVSAEMIQAELRRPTGDVQRTAQVLTAEGVRLFHQGRLDEATEVFAGAQAQVSRAGIRNAWVAPLLPWLATTLRQQVEKNSFLTRGRRRNLWRRAWAAARQGRRLARRFQNELPHALREIALLLALRGRYRRARRYFQESLAVARQQGAAYEHAQTLLAQGRVGLELGWPAAATEKAEAEQALQAIESAVPISNREARTANREANGAGSRPSLHDSRISLSLADRFDTVLDAGRCIALALTRPAVFAAIREAARLLLRGERCLVLEVETATGGAEVPPGGGEEIDAEYSQTVVKRALQTGRAVAFMEGATGQSSESVLLSGVRSALCAPIFLRGRAVGCLYVTHRQVAGLFGGEEERLTDFITTLGGAALENAEGFAELRRLNETLEHQIAESRRAEKRIQEQAALLDRASDAISVQDLEGRVLYWNQSAEALYGWTAAEAIGRHISELTVCGPDDELGEASKLLRARGEWAGELREVTRDGREILVASRWSLVRDDAGRPKAKLVVNTNITEKKKLEAQFLRAQRVESIGTLAGGIAHDINNILTPILMGVDILRTDLPRAQQLALLSQMESCAQRGADMVKQILSFARGIGGRRVSFQLKHVIREIERLLSGTFPKSIDLSAEIARDLWLICGDATQLSQMLMNLCVNARDAMPEGGRLTITAVNCQLHKGDRALHPDAQPGSYVLVTVADTGTGIPGDILEKIFDPFFTTKEFGKGTGLGLATVQGIVKGHNGFINVGSVVGEGTQFAIYLPALEAEQPETVEHKPVQHFRGRGELVLVIDDEAFIRQVTQKNLEAYGYQVVTARSGQEAVSLYSRLGQEISLVVTDMMMPGMGGLTTIQELRRIDPKVRMVAMSGLPTARDEAAVANVELQGFLLKPFSAEQLLQTIHSAVRSL